MKLTLATVLLLAGVATSLATTPAQDAKDSKTLAALKADPKVNPKASNGADVGFQIHTVARMPL